jgi:hypothetical protein
MSEIINENLESLIPGGAETASSEAPQAARQANPQEAPSAEDQIKQLEAQLAALRNPPKVEVTQEQAKLLTTYDPVKGWPPHTEEEIAWLKANGRQIPTPKNGRLGMRAVTPMYIRLKRIANGLPVDDLIPGTVSTTQATGEAPPERRPGPALVRHILVLEISPEYEGILKSAEYGQLNAFESAAEAARLLEVSPSALSQAIKKANGKPWTVKGVAMQYQDVYESDDSNFSPND